MAFGKKSDDEESKWSPEEWLQRSENAAKFCKNEDKTSAYATVALVYEQRRTNELLAQLLAQG